MPTLTAGTLASYMLDRLLCGTDDHHFACKGSLIVFHGFLDLPSLQLFVTPKAYSCPLLQLPTILAAEPP